MARRRNKAHRIDPLTRTLTGVELELDEARKWQARQMHKLSYWKLKRRIAAHGLLAVYRARKAARPAATTDEREERRWRRNDLG